MKHPTAERYIGTLLEWLPLYAALAVGSVMGVFSTIAGAASLQPVKPIMACTDLLEVDFTSVEGAPMRLDSATEITTNVPQPYCDVIGYVAPRVRFQVRLPMQAWTQRFVMAGCGAYCGALAISLSFNRAAAGCLPLQAVRWSSPTLISGTDVQPD